MQLSTIRDQIKKKKKAEDDQLQEKIDATLIAQNIKELQADVKTKANITDVCALVDSKASTNTVYQLLDEMKKSIVLLNGKVDNEFASSRHVD